MVSGWKGSVGLAGLKPGLSGERRETCSLESRCGPGGLLQCQPSQLCLSHRKQEGRSRKAPVTFLKNIFFNM